MCDNQRKRAEEVKRKALTSGILRVKEVLNMHAWEAIQKTLDYIETHIGEDVDIGVLAETAALSVFYYQRLFSRLVKKPVREYIRLRRLARASAVLDNKRIRILDIALDYGFGGHATFTRAFKDAYGITPEQYREQSVLLNHFDKPDMMLQYVMVDEGVPLISDGLVLEMNRRDLPVPISFMGIKDYVPIPGQLPVGQVTGVDIPGEMWRRFHQVKQRLPRIADGRELGVSYMGDAPEGFFTYFAGAEVEDGAQVSGFQAWQLPARAYVICGFEAENFHELTTVALDKAIQFSGRWLQQHDLSAELFAPEVYYGSTTEASYMELWLPVNKA